MAKQLTKEKQVLVNKVKGFEKDVLLILFEFGPIMDNNQKAKAANQIAKLVESRVNDLYDEAYEAGAQSCCGVLV